MTPPALSTLVPKPESPPEPHHFLHAIDAGVSSAPSLIVPKTEPLPESPRFPTSTSSVIVPKLEPLPELPHLPLETYASSVSCTAIACAEAIAPAAFNKKQKRSCELVRVANVPDEVLQRDAVRRARTTYECLRSLLGRQRSLPSAGKLSRDSPKRCRPDLDAASIMGRCGLWLFRDKRIIGSIPGILVGDVFLYRMELCVVGLHGQVQAGIDFITANQSPTGKSIATSIVVSGGYEDNFDCGTELIYTGHGGKAKNVFRQRDHQKLERGNLALVGSYNYGIEVRVIRSANSDRSPTGKAYVYDGLYKVIKHWTEPGVSGFSVYKYKLVRIDGQGKAGTELFLHAERLRNGSFSEKLSSYLTNDLSKGKEKLPIVLFNDIDDNREPMLSEYLRCSRFPPSVSACKSGHGGPKNGGCGCLENCSTNCPCILKNGGFPYDENGILVKGKPLVYECGAGCECSSSCPNRVTQNGLSYRLEVFRTNLSEWRVRSLEFIPAGHFICEFAGVVLTKKQLELESVSGNGLVYPGLIPAMWEKWGDLSDVDPDHKPCSLSSLPRVAFALDVSNSRNIACYLKNSRCPNVFVQFVLFDQYNESYPHLMIFALENIPPMRELSLNYGLE
ncbi:Histone-lysine N-methyltransferase, H3 lysine-9, H3 lysine-27, H4 lysine-20 and cytosine specific SUVH2 [Apostasia shenzhenica]|uniref:Histone-lysine N-methyltransferase, H3 lysine-9, H3 lysine-27, H4 lysine-20 and cytosine specific SUVH2 n=1 Tax=Apostasia shenzhenica TaxID=1088818 RepID=A0A2I0AUJ1_9ASPA|nr:Histone-lysine N-methyltransferase, H3 lysine-9, H3 lysine-27, H4 lysine-20 and cytosine specific SUVH2 [Apostasia shenzhenica]